MSSSSSTSLAPGFRFHPTDEELVRYYLRRKVCGKPFRFDAISDVDVYKVEPWDLPGKSRLKTKDLEWYFFSMLDKKYGNSSRTNRATERGYWKTTGKDRAVYHKSQVVGMKKTLVYHCGRAPRGQRTNWVMHEYKLTDQGLEKVGIAQDAIVLCRVFQKSGAGPKNGAQYGAPLVEEEWEDDELEMVPKVKDVVEVKGGGDTYLDEYDLEQILGADIQPVEAPQLEFSCGTEGTFVEDSSELTNGAQNILVGNGENHCVSQLPDSQKLYEMPNHYETKTEQVGHQYLSESSNSQNLYEMPNHYETKTEQVGHQYLSESSKTFGELDYLLDESFWDAAQDLQFGDGEFLETNDMLNPIAADTYDFDNMIAEYLTFHDASDDNLNYMAFDPPKMVESVELPSRVAFLTDKDANEGTQQAIASSEMITEHNTNTSSFSKQEPVKFASENNYPFIKKASQMLGSIPAPPAFAAEFPTKKAARLLKSLSQSSRSMCVTAGVMQVRNLPRGGNGTDSSAGKHGVYNIILSIGLSRDGVNSSNLESTVSIHPGKSFAALSRVWFYFIFLWAVVISLSLKFGSVMCAR